MADLSKILLDEELDNRETKFNAKYSTISDKLRRIGRHKIGSKVRIITYKPLVHFMEYFTAQLNFLRSLLRVDQSYHEFWITQGNSEPIEENEEIIGYITVFERTA